MILFLFHLSFITFWFNLISTDEIIFNYLLFLFKRLRDKLIDYIEEVNKSANDFKEITNYSLSADKIKEDFEENHNSIEDLRKRVKLQNEEINYLRCDLNNKDNEISSLKIYNKRFKRFIRLLER